MEQAKRYYLHGRELKVGDFVFRVHDAQWQRVDWVRDVAEYPHNFAWDSPPKVDISKIKPPLAFTADGEPIRVGSAMYSIYGKFALLVQGIGCFGSFDIVDSAGKKYSTPLADLTYDFPKSIPKKKVLREFWINSYGNRHMACSIDILQ